MTVTTRYLVRALCGVTAAAFALTAALTDSPSSPIAQVSPFSPRPARADDLLTTFEDCEQLRDWYVRETLPHVTPWGLDTGGIIALAQDESALRTFGGTPASTPAVGNGPTGTNVQETGVDEPDIAKTVADYVVSIRQHTLLVTDVSTTSARVVARLALGDRLASHELLVIDDRVLVLGQSWSIDTTDTRVMSPYGQTPRTSMAVVDLSDPSNPVMLDRRTFSGELIAARAHDGIVRLVVSQTGVDLPFIFPGGDVSHREARRHNRALVTSADLDAWLPQYLDADDAPEDPLVGCADVRHPTAGSGLGTITVMTMDPSRPGDMETAAITADGSLVYVSPDRLYVATVVDGWSGWATGNEDAHAHTDVHAFSVEGSQTSYVASGQVDGVVPDRWAFSEDHGLLRVASTLGPFWRPTQSKVTVLAERREGLVALGSVSGLGKREQITAVRWFGDLAVVVTFRQTDPLYTLDLSDPTAPELTGELKITGFSSYLHPVGSDIVLGIGQSADRSGRTHGSQVSSFDLTDVRRIDKLDLTSSYSPVEDDARAFTYLPGLRLALVAGTDWSRGSGRISVVSVGDDGSLSMRQEIRVGGWTDQIRALPLTGERVAIVVEGHVQRVLSLV